MNKQFKIKVNKGMRLKAEINNQEAKITKTG